MGQMTQKILLVPEKRMSQLFEEKAFRLLTQASLSTADKVVVHLWQDRWIVMILLATDIKGQQLTLLIKQQIIIHSVIFLFLNFWHPLLAYIIKKAQQVVVGVCRIRQLKLAKRSLPFQPS